jgi:hypothetical protein
MFLYCESHSFGEVDTLDIPNPKEISFVHNALPDLSLNEIDTTLKIGIPAIELKVPILILSETPEAAKTLSIANTEVPVAIEKNNGLVLYLDGKACNVRIYNARIGRAGDGIEAAKVIRTGGIPFIGQEQIGELQLYVKQLRIVMFLTNSKDIDHLKEAPVYVTR